MRMGFRSNSLLESAEGNSRVAWKLAAADRENQEKGGGGGGDDDDDGEDEDED